MKIHFYRYLNFLVTLLLVLFGLFLVKIIGFDFALNLIFFVKIFSLFLFFFIFLESIKNRKEIGQLVRYQSIKIKNRFRENSHQTQMKIIASLPFFSGALGKDFALWVASFLTLIAEVKNILSKYLFSKYNFFALFVLGVLFEIFVISSLLDLLVLLLVVVWVITIRLFRFQAKVSIIGALIFLTASLLLLIFNKDFLAEKSANWAYMFLLIGIVQTGWNYRAEIAERDYPSIKEHP